MSDKDAAVEQITMLLDCLKDDKEALRQIRLAATKLERQLKPGAVAVKYQHTEFSMRLATDLLASVKNNYPFTPQPNLEQWAHDIECLVRLDNYDRRVVEGALQFSQYDEFWRQQVRSGANLRKHFVAICVKAKEYQAKHGQTIKV